MVDKGIGVILLLGLGLWFWTKRKPAEVALEVITPPAKLVELPKEAITAQYERAGYTGKQLEDIVNAITKSQAEMARIQAQTPAVTIGEIQGGLAITQAATEQALAEVAIKPAEYAPFTPKQIADYKSEPAKNIYGIECTTQACALEAAERQYYIASIQTDPAIKASMMLMAEGMFEQAALYVVTPAPVVAPVPVVPAPAPVTVAPTPVVVATPTEVKTITTVYSPSTNTTIKVVSEPAEAITLAAVTKQNVSVSGLYEVTPTGMYVKGVGW